MGNGDALEDPAEMFVSRLTALSVLVSAFDCVHSGCDVFSSGRAVMGSD